MQTDQINWGRIAYWAAFIVFGVFAAYDLFWLVADILARLELWPRDIMLFDMYTFVGGTPLSDNLFFYASIALKLIGLTALAMRRGIAVPALGAGLILQVADWVSLSMNFYYDGSGDMTFAVIVQVIALVPLAYAWMAGELRR